MESPSLFPVMSTCCLVTVKKTSVWFSQTLSNLAWGRSTAPYSVLLWLMCWVWLLQVIYINICVNQLMGMKEVQLPLMCLLLWFTRRQTSHGSTKEVSTVWVGNPPKQKMLNMIQLWHSNNDRKSNPTGWQKYIYIFTKRRLSICCWRCF